MEHNHAAQAARPDALRVKQFLRERASATQETPQQIMSQAVEGIHANVAAKLPSKETIKRNIRKKRNKDRAPPIPENVGNLVLPQVSNTNNSYKLISPYISTNKFFVSSFEDDDLGHEKSGDERFSERKWLSTKGPGHQTVGGRKVREPKGRRRKECIVKKRISLRSLFHKKLKVNSSKRLGMEETKVYDPHLWYYNLLKFIID
ncbi:hypothetical protein RN001_009539 [Aquatica leii]|uniref:Uncharacterized protein n=1 Tax=Aquatica leii TaxID=1421715 RepID=A0AAN7SMY7_9COLE|nr:hypothetical protein RN001_009539 [Aquatica leii]